MVMKYFQSSRLSYCHILLIEVVVCQRLLCPNAPSNLSDLTFDPDPPGDLEFACPRGSASLTCCMAGFTRVEWYEYVQDIDRWVPFFSIPNERYPDPLDHGQTLRLDHVLQDRDGTNFSCVGHSHHRSGSPRTIVNNITLKILNCNVAGPSTFLKPPNQNMTANVTLGQSYHIECLVRFNKDACGFGCNVWWYRFNETTLIQPIDDVKYDENTTSRIYHMETDRDKWGFATSTLHITSVEEEDLSWSYVCDGSGEFLENYGPRTLTLREEEVPTEAVHSLSAALLSVAIVSSVIVLLFIVFGVTYCRYKVEIGIIWKTKWGRRRHQFQDKQHDVFILHNTESEEDQTFVRSELQPLLAKDYRVFSMHEVNYGQSIFDSMSSAVENSSVMVVIVSPMLLENEECKTTINDAVNTNLHTIYLIRVPINMEARREDSAVRTAIRIGVKVTVGEKRKFDGCIETRNTVCKKNRQQQSRDSSDFWMRKLQLEVIRKLEKCRKARQEGEEITSSCMYIPWHPLRGLPSQISQEQSLV